MTSEPKQETTSFLKAHHISNTGLSNLSYATPLKGSAHIVMMMTKLRDAIEMQHTDKGGIVSDARPSPPGVTLTRHDIDGKIANLPACTFSCTVKLPVRPNGIRVELTGR
jgi:hypothetical protein